MTPFAGRQLPSFQDVYHEYVDFVWASGVRFGVVPNEMDDLVQDIFMVIHSKLHTLENPQALRSWIYGVVRRTASNHRRTKKAYAVPATPDQWVPEHESHGPTPLEETERKAQRELLTFLLNQLDEPKREVFALVEIHELSVPEAAEALGIPLNTAYSRLRVARQCFEAAVARHEASGKGTR
jgi:RNA polymerase sigma-70 factor (ECF subfamily)